MNARLLRVAREAAGLTQTQAAKNAGVSQAEWSRWEKALRTPPVEQLEKLAAVVGVTPEALQRTDLVGQPVHRSQKQELRSVTKIADGRLELARIALERLLEGVHLDDPPLGFPSPEDLFIPNVDDAADALRAFWRIGSGPIQSLVQLIEASGGLVATVDTGSSVVDAAFTHVGSGPRWFWLNSRSSDQARVNFSLAHELGHAIRHANRFDAPIRADAERDADRFASALLMPRTEIRQALARIRPTLSELTDLARYWRVSVQALATRATHVGAISREYAAANIWRPLNRQGLLKSQLVVMQPDPPQLIPDVFRAYRDNDGMTDVEIARVIGTLSLERLRELMPGYFGPGFGERRLRLVSLNDQPGNHESG